VAASSQHVRKDSRPQIWGKTREDIRCDKFVSACSCGSQHFSHGYRALSLAQVPDELS
jgi:hypothetical protein